MSNEAVLLYERDGAVAVLTMNRPRQKNALDPALLSALGETLERAAGDASVRAVVLTGAGGAFCAGADLKAAMAEGGIVPEKLDGILNQYHRIIRAIVGAPKPFIAMVEGGAVGFGCDLALACDLRLMAEGAYLQEKFVKIGLMPDGGGTFWLPRLVGLARAMEILLFGEPVPAAKAVELGMANHVLPQSELRAEVMKKAHALAKGPPLAFAAIKRAVRAGLGGTIDGTLPIEKESQIKLLQTNDCIEGVMAWMQKRDPVFQGQ